MVEKVPNTVTRIQQIVSQEIIRVRCGAHQLNLSDKAVINKHMKESFPELLHWLISYL